MGGRQRHNLARTRLTIVFSTAHFDFHCIFRLSCIQSANVKPCNIELSCAAESNLQNRTSRSHIEPGEPQQTKSSRIRSISRRQLQRFVMTYLHMTQAGGRLSDPPSFTVSRNVMPQHVSTHARPDCRKGGLIFPTTRPFEDRPCFRVTLDIRPCR